MGSPLCQFPNSALHSTHLARRQIHLRRTHVRHEARAHAAHHCRHAHRAVEIIARQTADLILGATRRALRTATVVVPADRIRATRRALTGTLCALVVIVRTQAPTIARALSVHIVRVAAETARALAAGALVANVIRRAMLVVVTTTKIVLVILRRIVRFADLVVVHGASRAILYHQCAPGCLIGQGRVPFATSMQIETNRE